MRKSVSVELVSPKQTALLVYKPMKPRIMTGQAAQPFNIH